MANLPGKPSSRPTADLPARPASDADSRRARKRSGDTKKRRSERTSRNSADAGAPGPSGEAKPVAELGDDFVPFTLSEPEDEAPPAPAPRREWDEGKRSPRGRDRERGRDGERERGAKGKEREVERDDGYASKKQRVDAASRRAPWVAEVEWERCANVAEMLHKEVQAFIDFISPTPVEHEIRGLVIALISNAVTKAFPDAKVLPFGSYETKLYLPLGDIDLVIESDSMAYSDKLNVLHALANTVRRAGITDKVTIIGKAKVPIIKFVTSLGRFAVDISINQINGVAAGRMVNRFIAELPALRALVLVTKSFLSQRSMNEVFTGGLGSYSIVCLAVSFLQMHPKIRRGEIDPAKNLGVLVMEFFELYGTYFNYQDVGISLRDGGTYYNKAQRGWSDFRNTSLLSIEDPADPANDISKGSYNIMRVRQTFAGAHGIMTAAAYQRAETISARRSGRYISFRGDKTDPEEWSILMSVMGVTQETLNHRRLVQEVFDKGTLHRMAGIEPVAGVRDAGTSRKQSRSRSRSSPSRKAEAKSVAVAWGVDSDRESDAAQGSDGEAGQRRKRKRSKRDRGCSKDHVKEEEEESRYAIVKEGAGPPVKRRRTGKNQDVHTVFTTDDEDEEEGLVLEDDDSLADEEAAYAEEVAKEVMGTSRQKGSRRDRRSYWLSKGIGPDVGNDSE